MDNQVRTTGYVSTGEGTSVSNHAAQLNVEGTVLTTTSTDNYAYTYGTQNIINRKSYDINISAADFGFIVKVGCKTFCIESPDKLCKYIKKYLKNPSEIEDQWTKGELSLDD